MKNLFSELDSATEARDAGIATVTGNAGSDWKASYLAMVERWLHRLPHGEFFIAEQIRLDLEPAIGEPHHANAWGGMFHGVVKRWLKKGIVVRDGMGHMKTAKSHARLSPQYKKI